MRLAVHKHREPLKHTLANPVCLDASNSDGLSLAVFGFPDASPTKSTLCDDTHGGVVAGWAKTSEVAELSVVTCVGPDGI